MIDALNDESKVTEAECDAAHGDSPFRFELPKQPDEVMMDNEAFDELATDATRDRQEIYQRIMEFILRDTRLNPQTVAARVLILGQAFSPDAMARETEKGSACTPLSLIAQKLGRTRAALSARSKNLEREISELGGTRVTFACSRSDSTRQASRLAALGNSNRLGKPSPSRA